MLAIALIAAVVCVTSLAAGLAVRSRLTGAALLPPAGAALSPRVAACRWPSLTRALLRPERRLVTLIIWLVLVDTALALAAPLPLMVVADHGLSHTPYPAWLAGLARLPAVPLAIVAALAGLVLLAASATAGYLVTFLAGAASERMAWRLRGAVVSHVLGAQPRRVAAFPLGELASRAGADTARVADTVTGIIETVIPDVTVLAGMIAVTAFLDWRLTLVVLGVIPLYAVTARLRNRSVSGAAGVARARSGDLAAFTADLLARIPVVHIFDRAGRETGQYQEVSGRAAAAAVAALDAGARFSPVTDTLPGLGTAGALVAGTIEVTAGRLTIGGLLVLLAYLSSMTGPVRSLARLSTTVARGSAARERVAGLLTLPPLEAATACPAAHGSAPRAGYSPTRPGAGLPVALAGVSYSPLPGRPVLQGVDLHVPAGELLCINGPSGAGKSTLLSLLIRLADPQAGTITIGEHDIAALPVSALRRLVTLVPQDPWLHTGTIASNIGYGRAGATQADIEAAAELAGVASFAAALPGGYATPVGEHGRQLSGGQQRRVAVARALLRDTPILLLDEPTTGLDRATESRLVTDLLAVAGGKTVILVTHQPRLAALADRVITLQHGTLTSAAGTRPAAGPPAAWRPRPGPAAMGKPPADPRPLTARVAARFSHPPATR